jgi:RNA polymerase sigma-70 factor (ECF subfamily)
MTSDYSNKDLAKYLAAFQRGEEQGFNYFFKALYPALLYYAFNIVKNKEQAEKIVSDSFIQVWEKHEELQTADEIRHSLYTAIGNICIQRGLIAGNEKQVLSTHNIIMAEAIHLVHKTVKELPDECRTVFEMMYIHGKTVKEVATELNLSISAVEEQRALAVSLLRKKFPDLFPKG